MCNHPLHGSMKYFRGSVTIKKKTKEKKNRKKYIHKALCNKNLTEMYLNKHLYTGMKYIKCTYKLYKHEIN